MATSVAARMAVTAAMFEAEIGEACGRRVSTTVAGPRCVTAPGSVYSPSSMYPSTTSAVG